jgi:hypothetical protein
VQIEIAQTIDSGVASEASIPQPVGAKETARLVRYTGKLLTQLSQKYAGHDGAVSRQVKSEKRDVERSIAAREGPFYPSFQNPAFWKPVFGNRSFSEPSEHALRIDV